MREQECEEDERDHDVTLVKYTCIKQFIRVYVLRVNLLLLATMTCDMG